MPSTKGLPSTKHATVLPTNYCSSESLFILTYWKKYFLAVGYSLMCWGITSFERSFYLSSIQHVQCALYSKPTHIDIVSVAKLGCQPPGADLKCAHPLFPSPLNSFSTKIFFPSIYFPPFQIFKYRWNFAARGGSPTPPLATPL